MATKAPSKTQLLKLVQQRSSPYTKRHSHPATVPKGSHRSLDTNDYSKKYVHGPMYIRDSAHPFIHYRIPYSAELELWLLEHNSDLDAKHPPRYSSIRTATHETHKILGSDVKSFHQLKDSGFRYQEKFPHCLRICLDGMGKTGSSNRPYALSLPDFTHHFTSISLAYRGGKKAKLCLYEQPSHRPRIEWLRQLTHLVFPNAGEYDPSYELRHMHFDGHQLIEVGHPIPTPMTPVERVARKLITSPLPLYTPMPQLTQPTTRSRSRPSPMSKSLMCEEELTASEEDSDTETVVQEQLQQSVTPPTPMVTNQGFSSWPYQCQSQQVQHESQSTVEEEEEFEEQQLEQHPVTQPVNRLHLLSSPLPRTISQMPSFAYPCPSLPLRIQSNLLASNSMVISTPIVEQDQLMVDQSQTLTSQPSVGFNWLSSKSESVTVDGTAFFNHQYELNQINHTLSSFTDGLAGSSSSPFLARGLSACGPNYFATSDEHVSHSLPSFA